MLGEIAQGKDPRTGKRISALSDITLKEVLQKFLEIKPIRDDTKRNYHYAINRHLNDWLDIPITSITKDMVEQRHQELTVSPNRLGTSGHGRANNVLKKLSALINFASPQGLHLQQICGKLYDIFLAILSRAHTQNALALYNDR